MDFLKSAALPQPMEHVQLLLFMMNLIFVMLIPYLGFLLGTSLLSYIFRRRALRTSDIDEMQCAEALIATAVGSKSLMTFLAIIPALSLVFLMAQLLQGTPSISPGLMAFGFLCLFGGSVLLYTYRFSFRLSDILQDYGRLLEREKGTAGGKGESIARYSRRVEHTNNRAGLYGIVFLTLASMLTVGAITVAGDPDSWPEVSDILDLLLTGGFVVHYLEFLAVAGSITGIGILYFLVGKKVAGEGVDEQVERVFQPLGIRISSWSLIFLPVVVVGSVAVLPSSALTGSVFSVTGLAIVSFFVAAHFLYALKRESRHGYARYAFLALAFGLIALMTRDQLAIRSATSVQAVQLASVAERDVDELKARLGVVVVKALTGQEIYDAKCSACHLFDAKKIGPAYKDVVPKYFGRKAQMIAFVMNPVKVDPAFPSMPNQGLRSTEADSIVTFLLTKFSPKAQTAQSSGK